MKTVLEQRLGLLDTTNQLTGALDGRDVSRTAGRSEAPSLRGLSRCGKPALIRRANRPTDPAGQPVFGRIKQDFNDISIENAPTADNEGISEYSNRQVSDGIAPIRENAAAS